MASRPSQLAASRTLRLDSIRNLTEEQAYEVFVAARFAANGGKPFCPRCPAPIAPAYKLKNRRTFTCKHCSRQFSATTGTEFADRKLSFKKILETIAEFSTPTTGINANVLSRRLGINYRTGYLLGRKLREFMHERSVTLEFSGEVEVDGAYIGGFVRPPNSRKSKQGKQLPKKLGANAEKRQVVVVIRQRRGAIATKVFAKESDSVKWVRSKLPRGVGLTVFTDCGQWWSILKIGRNHKRVNHDETFWTPEADTNSAESFFGIMRRVAKGIYHRISGKYLYTYTAELGWRQEHNKCSDGDRYLKLLGGVASHLRPQWTAKNVRKYHELDRI